MIRKRVIIKGLVQGVGFRPFVYGLASRLALSGSICNTQDGVTIEIEGDKAALEMFMSRLKSDTPPLARIDSVNEQMLQPTYKAGFKITQSTKAASKTALLPPDIALCKSCKEDMDDPKSRYHNYYMISCSDCGPRYSIIRSVPYDRANTAMDEFVMCARCEEEFLNPKERRYHAQTISCPECGPRLTLLNQGEENGLEAIRKCAALLKEGKIAAVKGMGGFHLLCDATNEKAVNLLRKRKKRDKKPFAVMFKSIEEIKSAAVLSKEEESLICSKERPIVLVKKNSACKISSLVAPDIDRLGVFLPYTPLQHLLFKEIDTPLVATSANLSESPIITKCDELLKKLGKIADCSLDYDREIINACDDSLLQTIGDKAQMLRLARGYAPMSLNLETNLSKKILAVGASQKSSIAIAFGDTLVLSPHIGDLNTIEAFEYFTRTLTTFKEFYDFEPDVIVCDKHPGYMTTQWAKEQKTKNPKLSLIEVQHHYAHILACMAEHRLDEKVLGFAFDGTGQGDDGSVWGGEVFIADTDDYERVYHIRPFRLIGSALAVKEPRRAALSLLFGLFTPEELQTLDNPTLKAFSPHEMKLLYTAWKNGVNSPYASSMGRIFDAFASLAGFVQLLGYEGQSGLMIEAHYDESIKESYSFDITNNQIILDKMVRETLIDIKNCDKKTMASKFINTIADIILKIVNESPALPVVLGGGVFQNKTLLELVASRLEESGRRYYFQQKTPINDGGIALGQIYKAIKGR